MDQRVVKPFSSLEELYTGLDTLVARAADTESTNSTEYIVSQHPNPVPIKLRESTDYIYSGHELEKASRPSKLTRDRLPRTLVCHDMKGGYLEDRFIHGSKDHESYLFYHWSVIDIFVYFSHHMVTIPPFGWINAAHKHGVKVLGTLITENKDGEKVWDQIFSSPEETQRFADALISLANIYGFEGWLLNIENKINPEDVGKLLHFVQYLTQNIHSEIPNAEIIWYDSVTNEGQLKWQNQLNAKNEQFFASCDGIFLNYNWSDPLLASSKELAAQKNRVRDVYVGLDVWGRGCPGGGGFNSLHALEKIRNHDLSVAIFAPGWTHENFGPATFSRLEDIFWSQLAPHLYVHAPIYEDEEFFSSFCRGSGSRYYLNGDCLPVESFYNLTQQETQLSVPALHLKFTYVNIPVVDTNGKKQEPECTFETEFERFKVQGTKITFEPKQPEMSKNYVEFNSQISYNGGGCLELVTNDTGMYQRLFLVHLEFKSSIQVVVIHRESEDALSNNMKRTTGPTLVLINDTSLNFLQPNRTFEMHGRWKESSYTASMRTINEIGILSPTRGKQFIGKIKVVPIREALIST